MCQALRAPLRLSMLMPLLTVSRHSWARPLLRLMRNVAPRAHSAHRLWDLAPVCATAAAFATLLMSPMWADFLGFGGDLPPSTSNCDNAEMYSLPREKGASPHALAHRMLSLACLLPLFPVPLPLPPLA